MRPLKILKPQQNDPVSDSRITVLYSPDGMEDILHEEMSVSGDIVRRSDVSILLNQKLLENRSISPLALQKFADRLRNSSSSDLLKGQPDSVLMDVVKSRYIQSPADVYKYNLTIERDLAHLEDDVQEYVKQQNEVQPSNTPQNEE